MAGRAPQVRLGTLTPGGIAPSVYALVERGAGRRPQLAAGVPRPTNARGRAALATVASGRVRLVGNRALARRLLQLLAI